jgi:hypothetical protein
MNLKIEDFFVGTFSGALVAGVVSYVSPPFMPMLLGRLIGMLLVIQLKIALMPLFGAFKVMIPLSIIGMTVGMGAGMFSFTTVSSKVVIASGALPATLIILPVAISTSGALANVLCSKT